MGRNRGCDVGMVLDITVAIGKDQAELCPSGRPAATPAAHRRPAVPLGSPGRRRPILGPDRAPEIRSLADINHPRLEIDVRPVSRQTELLLNVIERRPMHQSTTKAVSSANVQVFFDACVYARLVHLYHRIVRDFIEIELLRCSRAVPMFLRFLYSILSDSMILQVCKVTDPVRDSRGNANYTIDFFTKNCVPARGRRFALLDERIRNFRKKLKPARDKIIVHIDQQTVEDGKNLGGASDNEWDEFWNDLDELVGIIYEHFRGKRESIISVARLSDEEFVVRALKASTAYFEVTKPSLGGGET
jgi:hypothetical protein